MKLGRHETLCFVASLIGAAALATAVTATPSRSDVPSVDQVLGLLDSRHPGRGQDQYLDAPADHAMAYGLYASASALSCNVSRAEVAADWLVTNSQPAPTKIGWGLPFAWDAFSDGTTNPVKTVYGITTALAVRGLVDTYLATNSDEYLETAEGALDYYSRFFTSAEPGGYFWYSDQPSDAISVHNVTSMLLGQYAIVGKLSGREDFLEIATAAADYLWSQRQSSPYGEYWPYSTKNAQPNDAVHAAYAVQGLIDYQRALGETRFDLSDSVLYLTSFSRSGEVFQFAPHQQLKERKLSQPASLWGLAMVTYTLIDADKTPAAEEVLDSLRAYKTEDGSFSTYPDGEKSMPRMITHLALAVARLENPSSEVACQG